MSVPTLRLENIQRPSSIQEVQQVVDLLRSQAFTVERFAVQSGADRQVFAEEEEAKVVSLKYSNIRIYANNSSNQLRIILNAQWKEPDYASLMVTSLQDTMFTYDVIEATGFTAEYYWRKLLDIGKAIYALSRPIFGWCDFCEPYLAPSREQVQTLRVFDNLQATYWADFFSPRLVEHITRARLENPPIGWSENLPDGGMLYIMAPTFFHNDAMENERLLMKNYFRL